jgi:hypothetical protein
VARAFYLEYLGFSMESEHRFEDDLPLYMCLARDGARLDLSEHQVSVRPRSRQILQGTNRRTCG